MSCAVRTGGLRAAVFALVVGLVAAACASAATSSPTSAATPAAETASATPGATPGPTLAPNPRPTPSPSWAPYPTPEPSATDTPEPTPTDTPAVTPSETPPASDTPGPTDEPTSTPLPSMTPPAAFVLTPAGVQDARLGDSPDQILPVMIAMIGQPDVDDGWVPVADSASFGRCPGTNVRAVIWGPMVFLFTNGATAFGQAGRQHLFEIRFGPLASGEGTLRARAPVRTQTGITIGSTRADLVATYGSSVTFEPLNTISGPTFHVGPFGPGGLFGIMDEVTDSATVVALEAGQPCADEIPNP